jgi:hypothetical protein
MPETRPQVILVGDPRQLPPTVLSRSAEAARLSQSLFERLQRAGVRAQLLDRQFRMHPRISRCAAASQRHACCNTGTRAGAWSWLAPLSATARRAMSTTDRTLAQTWHCGPLRRSFPSSYLYDGQLRDGAGITPASRAAPCHALPLLGPLVVWDVAHGRERPGGGGSLRNGAEAELAAALYAGALAPRHAWRRGSQLSVSHVSSRLRPLAT